jgi:hypothetical protein
MRFSFLATSEATKWALMALIEYFQPLYSWPSSHLIGVPYVVYML